MTYILSDVHDAYKLYADDQFKEALEIFINIHEQSVNEKKDSAFIIQYIAICYDFLGDPLKAALWINKAKSLDPYCLGFENTADIIYENISRLFTKASGNIKNSQEVYRLFDVLKKNGRVKSNCQFVMICFYMKEKKYKAAREMLDNALERNPLDSDFIKLRSIINLKEGNTSNLNCLLESEKNNLLPFQRF